MHQFKPAIREQVSLIIGLIGPSGSGKTMSAMKLASGIVGPGNRFVVIDTESRRALHYADMFNFDYAELHEPFTPKAYMEAIKEADTAGYRAIVVDQISSEWSGEGGVLEMAESELQRMAGDDYKKRDACKMASWIKPKMAHKQMVQRLLQCRAHLILCFRAEEKIKMEKDSHGKMQIVPIGFQPICSKELPYELTVSFLLLPDKPGFPQPIKLQEQHKTIFPLAQELNELSGIAIAEWAKGGISKPKLPIQEPQKKATNPPYDELLHVTQNIVGVALRLYTNRKTGKPSERYIVSDGNKTEYGTFDKKVAEAAKKAMEAGIRAELGYKQGEYGYDLVTIALIDIPSDRPVETRTIPIHVCPEDEKLPASIFLCASCNKKGNCHIAKELTQHA